MAVARHYRELIAWQLADAFKLEVFRLVQSSNGASRNLRFRDQLLESSRGPAKHITEGFRRFSPRAMKLYIDYALSSVDEACEHIVDGIQLSYFHESGCTEAFSLAKRFRVSALRLKHSQKDQR